MTDQTHPMPEISWEPDPEGIRLWILRSESQSYTKAFELPLVSVRELRDDMEEAAYLSRSLEKVECMASEVQPQDRMVVCGHMLTISDVLADYRHTFLQTPDDEFELKFPSDGQLTVWRPIQ